MDKVTFNFPNITVPEKEKDESYHKKFVQAITQRAVADGFNSRYSVANECVNFYLGLQSGDEFDFLQKAEDGEVLPAQWINYNKINVKINLLIGELFQKGYDIDVKALNKEARVRKLEEKKRLLVEMRFQPVAEELENEFGLPLQESGFIPEDEDQLDDYINEDYREDSEVILRYALKYLVKRNRWDYERMAMFRDLLIMGYAIGRSEIVDGMPVAKRRDPRRIVWDTNATDDFLSDSTYWGELDYITIGEAIERYQLTKEEIEETYNQYQTFSQNSNSNHAFTGVDDFRVLDAKHGLELFKDDGGDLRVLVMKACWLDYKKLTRKESKDKYGQVHIRKTNDEASGDEIIKKTIQLWRQGTLIAGKFLKEWGPMPNQTRSMDNLAITEPPYKAIVPNYMNNIAVSKVYQLQGLQKLKDITLYNIQLAMARAGSKGIIYDISQLPEGWDIHNAIKYLKTAGIMYIESMKDGEPMQFNQFKDFDMTLSQSITKYLEISAMVDREMDAISGINEARQGIVQSASQAVGVTQSALLQSNLSTEMYFKLFKEFCSDLLNHQAKLVKIAWAGKERFSAIIGDTGINFLETDVELDLNDYGVFVEELPPMINDKQTFQQLIIASVQSQSLAFDQAMELLLEKDVKVALRNFKRATKRKQLEQQAQEQMLMQQEQQKQQAQLMDKDADRQAKLKELEFKESEAMKRVMAQGRIKLNEIPLKGKVEMAKIPAQSEAAIEKEKAKSRPKPATKPRLERNK